MPRQKTATIAEEQEISTLELWKEISLYIPVTCNEMLKRYEVHSLLIVLAQTAASTFPIKE